MLLKLPRWPRLLQDVPSTGRHRSKQTGSSSTKGNHHPSFPSRFWIGQKKTVDAAKICGGVENVVKTETQQTFVNGLLSVLLRHLYPLEARVYCSHIAWVAPSIGNSICTALLSISFFQRQRDRIGHFPVKNSPAAIASQVLYYPRRRRWWSMHWPTDCFDVQPTTTSGNIITQSIIFSF